MVFYNDKSKKGQIDTEVKQLVETINALRQYYTTSSCSGRIVVYSVSHKRKKNETLWLLVSHQVVSFDSVKNILRQLPQETVWFRYEPLILHIVCKDIDAAAQLVKIASSCGFKHSGIMGIDKRVVVEIRGTDFMDGPIAKNGLLVIDDDALALFVAEANKKMEKNNQRREKLTTCLENVAKSC